MFSIFFSIIFGISLGIIFFSIFKFSTSIHGPNSNHIIQNIYYSNDIVPKKYKLIPKKCECPKITSFINFITKKI